MSVWNILNLVGGLAIFLYGMLLMNNSLTAMAGEKLRGIMLILTRGKVRGYLTGLGVTLLNQSSSATTVLEAVLVGASLMTFQQSLAVTLGAELGSTFLAQLVAFPAITRIAPLIIAASFFATLIVGTQKSRSLASTVLGFGLLLLGMELMSSSLKPLRSYQPFLDLMVRVENPILGILLGLVFTMIIQSSGATSGLVIAMGIAGTVNLAQAVPINLGASIGTCITAVLGSMALNREAKRTAYIHVLFQTIGVLFVYTLLLIPLGGERLWLVLVRWVTRTLFGSESLARQIAMAHTMMPVLNHLIVFPLLPLIVRLFNLVFPSKEEEHVFGPIHINDGLVGQPQIALEQATKEIMRTSGIVEQMMQRSYEILTDTSGSAKARETEIEQISLLDKKVDLLRNAIVAFLTKVARSQLTEWHSRETVLALNTINELENLADVVDVNILDRARKLFFELSACLDEQAIEDVASVHGMVLEHFRQVMNAFAQGDRSAAVQLLTDRAPFRDLQAEIRERHFQRLRDGTEESLQINPVYMDLLNHYNRINRHVLHIAKRMAENLEAGAMGSAAGSAAGSPGGGSAPLSGRGNDSAGSAPPAG